MGHKANNPNLRQNHNRRNFALVIVLSLLSAKASAGPFKTHEELSTKFIQTVELQAPGPKPEQIVYGNKDYGFFATDEFQKKGDTLVTKVVPPGYKKPIVFFAKRGPNLTKLTTKNFASPLPPAYRILETVDLSGSFSAPFFMVGMALPKERLKNPTFMPKKRKYFTKSQHRFSFAGIINRFGEVVWLHVPFRGGEPMMRYSLMKKVSKDTYGILFGKKSGYFELVRIDGTVLAKTDSRSAPDPYPMHHDFQFVSDREMIVVGNEYGKLTKKIKLDDKWQDYLSNTLLKVDVKNNRSGVVFPFSKLYRPETTIFHPGDEGDDEKFWMWKKPKVDFDFIHINTIEEAKDGYLIGLRNLNKLAFMTKNLSEQKWTLGYDKTDTFQIQGDGFFHCHTPQFLSDNEILLFDNGIQRQKSRALIMEFGAGKAKVKWSYEPKEGYYAKNRSSVHPIGTDGVLIFYVSPAESGQDKPPVPNRDVLIEVNRNTNQEVARMVTSYITLSPGYRAIPITNLAGERFLGTNPN